MPRPLARSQINALAESIRSILAMIDTGSMTASTATVYRLQGALVALDAVLGGDPANLLVVLTQDHEGP